MGKLIVVTGRGGSGKTAFAALATRFLPTPQLLIDADSDQSLAAMLGVDLQEARIETISSVLYDIQTSGRDSANLGTMPLPQKIEYLLQMSCLYEADDFDLLSIGVKWTQGCYCFPNEILRGILPELAKSYTATVVDSPGGLEHMNRRIANKIDDLFVVMDPSSKALRNVERLKHISAEVNITYENIYLVANHRFSESRVEPLQQIEGTTYLGQVPADDQVEEYDWSNRSLRELPESSPALKAVGEILHKTGYRVR